MRLTYPQEPLFEVTRRRAIRLGKRPQRVDAEDKQNDDIVDRTQPVLGRRGESVHEMSDTSSLSSLTPSEQSDEEEEVVTKPGMTMLDKSVRILHLTC